MKYITLDITSKCNLNGRHCYNKSKYSAVNKDKDDLPFAKDVLFMKSVEVMNMKYLDYFRLVV